MSGAEAALRGYNAELREGLAELRARREELDGRIREEEAERSRLQGRIWALTERLVGTSESLARNLAARSELDRTIAETEAAYGKFLIVTGLHLLPRTRWQDPTNAFYQCLVLRGTYLHLFSDRLAVSTSS
ncbi:uncharacterized protein VSU04_012834 isoform 1-T1 [Chlamydotis macqueenii]